MWFILYVILFIGFFEMIYSGVQRIFTSRDCAQLFRNEALDTLLLFFSRLIGLLLWTWPLIYVYWAREFIMSWRYKSRTFNDDEDEDSDAIDALFKQNDASHINHADSSISKLVIHKPVGLKATSREEDDLSKTE